MKREYGGFLTAMLGGAAREHVTDLANQDAFGSEFTGGVQKLAHLPAHIAKASWCTEDDSISGSKFVNGTDGHMGQRLLRIDSPHFLKYVFR
jgi:hypothetical protein